MSPDDLPKTQPMPLVLRGQRRGIVVGRLCASACVFARQTLQEIADRHDWQQPRWKAPLHWQRAIRTMHCPLTFTV